MSMYDFAAPLMGVMVMKPPLLLLLLLAVLSPASLLAPVGKGGGVWH